MLIIFGFCKPVLSQTAEPDTTISIKADTTQSIKPDTTKSAEPVVKEKKSDIDTTISYDAKTIINFLENRQTQFIGNAVVKYKQMTLKAGKITIDWDKSLLTAEPLADTTWVKTDSTSQDSTISIEIKEKPILIDGGSQMAGDKMMYNYKTEKGRVIRGRTDFEGGKYLGTQIKRVSKDVFNVSNSVFTTCDRDSCPHFHFAARRLKMITNDKVIAKPIVMYFGHIPVIALPFAVFPHHSGRQSGIKIPRYGQSAQEGRFLRDLGYYWAPNDYFDTVMLVDFFEKSGWLFKNTTNYAVRYLLSGTISGSFTRKNFTGGYKSRRWDLQFRHSQQISPTSRLVANGTFVSDKNFYDDLSTNLSTRLQRQVRSNATYTKTWTKSKTSLSINASRTHDLEDDVVSQTFPQLSFRKGQTQVFKSGSKSSSSSGRNTKWYHSLYYSYNSTLLNSKSEYLTGLEDEKETETTRNIKHNVTLSLTSPKKYFGWLSLNQTLNGTEEWFDEMTEYYLVDSTNTIKDQTVKDYAARHTFSYNASANTKIYGMFRPGIGDIQAIRHVVTPSVSFTYRPDFSDLKWGYYTEIADTTGEKIAKDKFGGTTSSYGQKLVSLSVRNLFQMKKGTGENEKKFDLFTMDFGTGYNFNAEKNRLSDFRTTWQANPAKNFSLSAYTTHSFYKWDDENNKRSNDYIFSSGWKKGKFLQTTSTRMSFSIRLKGKSSKGKSNQQTRPSGDMMPYSEEDNEYEQSVLEEDMENAGDRFESDRKFKSLNIPWQMNLGFNFSTYKTNPNYPTKRYYLDVSGAEINITKNWRIGYRAQYDLNTKEISYHSIDIQRDLHCWEARIEWVPNGYGKRIYFIINVKADRLKDIKVEKHGGMPSALGY